MFVSWGIYSFRPLIFQESTLQGNTCICFYCFCLPSFLGQRDEKRQDCEKAPAFELAPEQRMSFCWFQPEGPLRLRLRLGSQELLDRGVLVPSGKLR